MKLKKKKVGKKFVSKKKDITFATAYRKHGRLAQLV